MLETVERGAWISQVKDVRPARILVAEDDKHMRHLISWVLRKDGHEVIEAEDGEELLDLLGSSMIEGPASRYDVIISDIRMPGESGMEVLAGLRRSDWLTPVILITAFGTPETHEEAESLGVTAVFDKPFNMSDLRKLVTKIIDST